MLRIEPNEKILVVAPHPDDESIGCGGLLALYGRQCDVLLLTDGRLGKSEQRESISDEEIIATRLSEIEEALKIANTNKLYHLDAIDSRLKSYRKEIMAFNFEPYDYIFIPNSFEMHPDHKAANKFVKAARFWGKTKAKIYEYEVWTPLRSVDFLLDISSVEEIKKEMIEKHISQIECMNYINAGMGLSHYRGIGCRTNAGEAFYKSPATIFDKIKRIVRHVLNK